MSFSLRTGTTITIVTIIINYNNIININNYIKLL